MIAPQGLFEDLGLKYVGPVDGHDVEAVETALVAARDFGGPVIVHCVTEKGRGYAPAESDEVDRLHAIGGRPGAGQAGRRPQLDLGLRRGAGRDRRGAARRRGDHRGDAATRPGWRRSRRAYPDRVFDVGIAEQHAVTSAAGLAMGGLHPVVAIYATFLNRAFDQVLMDVALHRLAVTFVLDRAGVTGDDGPSHNGMWDLSMLQVVPGPADRRAAGRRPAARAAPGGGRGRGRPDRGAVPEGPGRRPTCPRWPRSAAWTCCTARARRTCCWSRSARWRRSAWAPRRCWPSRGSASPWSTRAGSRRWTRRWSSWPRGTGWSSRSRTTAGSAGSARAVAQALRDAGVDTPVRTSACRRPFLDHGSRAEVLAAVGLTPRASPRRRWRRCGPRASRSAGRSAGRAGCPMTGVSLGMPKLPPPVAGAAAEVAADQGRLGAGGRRRAGLGAVDDDDADRGRQRDAAADRRADRVRLPDRAGGGAVPGRRRGAAGDRAQVADPGDRGHPLPAEVRLRRDRRRLRRGAGQPGQHQDVRRPGRRDRPGRRGRRRADPDRRQRRLAGQAAAGQVRQGHARRRWSSRRCGSARCSRSTASGTSRSRSSTTTRW